MFHVYFSITYFKCFSALDTILETIVVEYAGRQNKTIYLLHSSPCVDFFTFFPLEIKVCIGFPD